MGRLRRRRIGFFSSEGGPREFEELVDPIAKVLSKFIEPIIK